MIADLSTIPSISLFRGLFTKPSFKHFVRYVHGLIASDRKNVKAINDEFMERKDQSSLNRFLTKYKWDEERLNELRIRAFLRNRDGVLIVDDSLIEKTGKRMEGVGYLFNPAMRKSVLCHNIVSTHYVSENEQLPMHFQFYLKKEIAKKEGKQFRTKIDIAIELLNKALKHINPSAIVFDAWYLSERLVKALKSRNWVARVKLNRLVLHKGEWIPLKDFTSKIPEKKFRKADINISNKKYSFIASCKVKLHKIGKVRIAVLKKKISSKKPVVIATNTDWHAETIAAINKKRFAIDTFYRDSKQYLGMEDYQMRSMTGVVKHLCLVFLAYSLLRDRCLQLSLSEFVKSKLRTTGEMCRAVKQKILGKFVEWSISLYEKVKSISLVINTAIECLN